MSTRLIARNLMSLCVLLVLTSNAQAYDVKTYLAVTGGVARLDDKVTSDFLIDDKSEAYEITGGLDLADRWSIEMSFSDLGNYKLEEQPQGGGPATVDKVSIHSFRFNGIFYLLSGARAADRYGLNLFVKAGLSVIEEGDIFFDSNLDVDGVKFNYGAGIEYAFDRSTAMRAQVQGFAGDVGYASLSIMWRWGRAPDK